MDGETYLIVMFYPTQWVGDGGDTPTSGHPRLWIQTGVAGLVWQSVSGAKITAEGKRRGRAGGTFTPRSKSLGDRRSGRGGGPGDNLPGAGWRRGQGCRRKPTTMAA